MYVTESSEADVKRETPSGIAYTTTVVVDNAHNGLQDPIGLSVDAAGDIYVGDGSLNLVLDFPAMGVDFGSGAVGTAAADLTLRFYMTGMVTLGTPEALTGGVSGKDFSAAAGTCTGYFYDGQDCTLSASFTPSLAGLREGAVALLDSSGNLAGSVAMRGTGSGAQVAFDPGTSVLIGGTVSTPQQTAVDGSGDVFGADSTLGVLEEKPSGGTYTQSTLGTGISATEGVAVDGAGNVYISDTGNGRIVEETPSGSGTTQTVLITGLSSPRGIAVDSGGNLYIALATGILRETPVPGGYVQTGVATATLPQGAGVAVGSDGTVFAVDAQGVLEAKYSNGVYTSQQVDAGGFSDPTGLALDAANNLYVYDAGRASNNLSILSAASSYAATIDVLTESGGALAVDASGNLYLFGSDEKQMERIDRSDAPSLDFSTTALGATRSLGFALDNLGTEPLRVSGVSSPGAGFSASGCAAGTILAGSACSESVIFAPQVLGAVTSSFAITDNLLGVANSQQTVNLSGTGAAAPLTITASSATVTVGNAIPAITPSYAGFVNGDTAASHHGADLLDDGHREQSNRYLRHDVFWSGGRQLRVHVRGGHDHDYGPDCTDDYFSAARQHDLWSGRDHAVRDQHERARAHVCGGERPGYDRGRDAEGNRSGHGGGGSRAGRQRHVCGGHASAAESDGGPRAAAGHGEQRDHAIGGDAACHRAVVYGICKRRYHGIAEHAAHVYDHGDRGDGGRVDGDGILHGGGEQQLCHQLRRRDRYSHPGYGNADADGVGFEDYGRTGRDSDDYGDSIDTGGTAVEHPVQHSQHQLGRTRNIGGDGPVGRRERDDNGDAKHCRQLQPASSLLTDYRFQRSRIQPSAGAGGVCRRIRVGRFYDVGHSQRGQYRRHHAYANRPLPGIGRAELHAAAGRASV